MRGVVSAKKNGFKPLMEQPMVELLDFGREKFSRRDRIFACGGCRGLRVLVGCKKVFQKVINLFLLVLYNKVYGF